MRLILILVGAGTLAYLLMLGIRAYLNERNQTAKRRKTK